MERVTIGELTTARCDVLSEKEKQTLRLMVRGHDAKSMARYLGLSVHTVNERLRDARRKLGVSSSREAARLLLDREGAPHCVGDKALGDAESFPAAKSVGGQLPELEARRVVMILSGALLVSLVLAALALVANPSGALQPAPTQVGPAIAPDPTVEQSARKWLALVDRGDWTASFARAGRAFRAVNTVVGWADASRQVRTPLGRAGPRQVLEQRYVNAPPAGYRQITFRSSFAGKEEAVEIVTLEREKSEWRVVGYIIE